MGLWYPGRPPFCSDELIWLLTQFVETLHELNATQDATRLQILDVIAEDALTEIARENDTCHGTDRVLNTLRKLFEDAPVVAQKAHQERKEHILLDIATDILVIRDELREEHEKLVRQAGLTHTEPEVV